MTTPSNPCGQVWTRADYDRLVNLCRPNNTWIVFDQAYCDFVYEGTVHVTPCGKLLGYERIVHLATFSKAYGMQGWRVGYSMAPKSLTDGIRKVCAITRINLHQIIYFKFYDIAVAAISSTK